MLKENLHPVNRESRVILKRLGVKPKDEEIHLLVLLRALLNRGQVPVRPAQLDALEALLSELELSDPSEAMLFLDLKHAPDGEGLTVRELKEKSERQGGNALADAVFTAGVAKIEGFPPL